MTEQTPFRIESLLSARLFLAPQTAGDRIYFISNMSGRLSLYVMPLGGGMPQPLLPPHIALQNPELIGGYLFHVLPELGQILVMLDQDGDENYQPMIIPIEGGYPERLFATALESYGRVNCVEVDGRQGIVYLYAERTGEAQTAVFQGNLHTGQLRRISQSGWSRWPDGISSNHEQLILNEGYTIGDNTLYLWRAGQPEPSVLIGTPLDQRQPGETYPLRAIYDCHFTAGNRGLLFLTAIFEDTLGLGYMRLAEPEQIQRVPVLGLAHTGAGQFDLLDHLRDDRYWLLYNIDGVSWAYEARFDETALTMTVTQTLVGEGELAKGVLESAFYDESADRHALAFSTATSPTQLYTLAGEERQLVRHTDERPIGLPLDYLAPGEDASFVSHDGLRVSARLYLPAAELGLEGKRPLVYYIHGGPQSQERPDFAWFSMPLIQFLTLNGFAVFVPNVRGSSGYGLKYAKMVDRDWGGQDRLDHVEAIRVLQQDPRLDTTRTGVIGRSYGGYMTLTLAGRHPELWSAAVDMFGPYDLLSFMDRIPPSWRPYFAIAVGDPAKDREFLIERSPRTYIDQIQCPLLVIQGQNDPRVIEQESRDVVEQLRAGGKQVDYLVFADEGHDVIKYDNKVRCYNAITDFFREQLQP